MISPVKVSIGPSSVLGWAAAAAALMTCIVQSVQEAQPLLSHGNKAAGVTAAGVLVATHAGRQYQARGLPDAPEVGKVLDELPSALAAFAAEAQANVAKVQESPDGTQSGALPFSGAPQATAELAAPPQAV